MTSWWSNCIIEGFKAKVRNWNNVELKPFFYHATPWRFHLMWFDKQEKCVKHFTHKMFEGGHSDFFFKGAIEVLTIARFNSLCEKKNKPHLVIH